MWKIKPERLSRRNFLEGAAILGGALVVGGTAYRQVHNTLDRNFQPERAAELGAMPEAFEAQIKAKLRGWL